MLLAVLPLAGVLATEVRKGALYVWLAFAICLASVLTSIGIVVDNPLCVSVVYLKCTHGGFSLAYPANMPAWFFPHCFLLLFRPRIDSDFFFAKTVPKIPPIRV